MVYWCNVLFLPVLNILFHCSYVVNVNFGIFFIPICSTTIVVPFFGCLFFLLWCFSFNLSNFLAFSKSNLFVQFFSSLLRSLPILSNIARFLSCYSATFILIKLWVFFFCLKSLLFFIFQKMVFFLNGQKMAILYSTLSFNFYNVNIFNLE